MCHQIGEDEHDTKSKIKKQATCVTKSKNRKKLICVMVSRKNIFPYFTSEKLMSINKPKSPALASSNPNSLRL